MKPHLLFSSLFMAALALSPLVAQSKTSHHKHKQINAEHKLFITGTFIAPAFPNGHVNKDTGKWVFDKHPINLNEYVDNELRIVSLSKGAYKINLDGTSFRLAGTEIRPSSCSYSNVLYLSYSKINNNFFLATNNESDKCNVVIYKDHKRISIHANSACDGFCDNNGSMDGFVFPIKFNKNIEVK